MVPPQPHPSPNPKKECERERGEKVFFLGFGAADSKNNEHISVVTTSHTNRVRGVQETVQHKTLALGETLLRKHGSEQEKVRRS